MAQDQAFQRELAGLTIKYFLENIIQLRGTQDIKYTLGMRIHEAEKLASDSESYQQTW